jgi:hypothetical protein
MGQRSSARTVETASSLLTRFGLWQAVDKAKNQIVVVSHRVALTEAPEVYAAVGDAWATYNAAVAVAKAAPK